MSEARASKGLTTSFTAISTNSESAGEANKVNKLVKQPETRPIGQEQLVAEVKSIYTG